MLVFCSICNFEHEIPDCNLHTEPKINSMPLKACPACWFGDESLAHIKNYNCELYDYRAEKRRNKNKKFKHKEREY